METEKERSERIEREDAAFHDSSAARMARLAVTGGKIGGWHCERMRKRYDEEMRLTGQYVTTQGRVIRGDDAATA